MCLEKSCQLMESDALLDSMLYWVGKSLWLFRSIYSVLAL
jgi:hypothetical protein